MMLIEGIQSSQVTLGTRWQANVIWEDCELPPQTLEITSPALSSNHPPAAFFALNMLPNALAANEWRVKIDAPLHSEFAISMPAALAALAAWSYPKRTIPELVAEKSGFSQGAPDRGCGMFLSGGADSLAQLIYLNRYYPSGHPLRPTHAFFVNGMDISADGDADSQAVFYESARQSLEDICSEMGVELVPMQSNLRQHGLARASWPRLHFGMALAGMAHAVSHQVAHMHIASGFSARHGVPKMGSHPCVEPFCSTSEMQIHLGLQHLSRSERVALVAQEPALLNSLRVCWQHIENDGPLNCSRCHKCMLTMLALVACGKLADCKTFGYSDVTPEMATSSLFNHQETSMLIYAELKEALAHAGRHDLTSVLEEKIRQTRYNLSERGRAWRRLKKSIRKRLRT